ncbi:hypothetical protein BURC_02510 [Burkholderiaceae bacterium]|nr:hypothetical protein BURC_02510 [Burkholderiaceae bacterium]
MDDYKQLFDAYLTEMREAQATANAWWEALLIREAQLGRDAAAAQEALDQRWPMGPVSHPAVIAVFRKWALECQALNDAAEDDDDDDDDEVDDDDESDWGSEDDDDEDDDDAPSDLATLDAPVEPRELLIEMLPGRADDLVEFLADFVFTPLGLDKDDRWI